MAPLKVIALISGGKDSLYVIQHCLANGHEVIALANLYPAPAVSEKKSGLTAPAPTNANGKAEEGNRGEDEKEEEDKEEEEVDDLNSFMYQTVGYSIVPLYESAFGIPLYRQQILGSAVVTAKDYQPPSAKTEHEDALNAPGLQNAALDNQSAMPMGPDLSNFDETESITLLLSRIMRDHPEANAVSTGAILSTYQRTRTESIALRLGLVPLGYLWQYPILPPYVPSSLLQDMADVGLDARIIKVSSGGLDTGFLWQSVASPGTVRRLERVVERFEGGIGGVLGEGGEFETLAIDGPLPLWKGKIDVSVKQEVMAEGGSAFVKLGKGRVVRKEEEEGDLSERQQVPRIPALLDDEFKDVLQQLNDIFTGDHIPASSVTIKEHQQSDWTFDGGLFWKTNTHNSSTTLSVSNMVGLGDTASEQLTHIFTSLQIMLSSLSLPSSAIMSSTLLLRNMSDFTTLNTIYASFFSDPNPPARVTVSVPLPEEPAARPGGPTMIHILLSVVIALDKVIPRHKISGLHVQSRSYWAPANIGPYSQAMSFPILPRSSSSTDTSSLPASLVNASNVSLVFLAGQIPLIPASMDMHLPNLTVAHSFNAQSVLALQHLFRVGRAVNVFTYSGIAGYISACKTRDDSSARAQAVIRVWRQTHINAAKKQLGKKWTCNDDNGNNEEDNEDDTEDDEGEEEEDDNVVVDVWDQKYGRQSASTSTTPKGDIRPLLPDYSRIEQGTEQNLSEARTGSKKNRKIIPIPFCIVAEVSELPRTAPVEWAGTGIAAEGHSNGHEARVSIQNYFHGHDHGPGQSQNQGLAEGRVALPLVRQQIKIAGTQTQFLWACIEKDSYDPSRSEEVGSRLLEEIKWALQRSSDVLHKRGHEGEKEQNEEKEEVTFTTTVYFAVGENSGVEIAIGGEAHGWIRELNAQVVPCRRVWSENGAELVAAVQIRTEGI